MLEDILINRLWAPLALALILSLASNNGVQRYILWLIAVSVLFHVYQRQCRHNNDVVPDDGNPTIEDEFSTLVTRPIQAFDTILNVALHTHVFRLNARPRNFPCRQRTRHSDVTRSNPENLRNPLRIARKWSGTNTLCYRLWIVTEILRTTLKNIYGNQEKSLVETDLDR